MSWGEVCLKCCLCKCRIMNTSRAVFNIWPLLSPRSWASWQDLVISRLISANIVLITQPACFLLIPSLSSLIHYGNYLLTVYTVSDIRNSTAVQILYYNCFQTQTDIMPCISVIPVSYQENIIITSQLNITPISTLTKLLYILYKTFIIISGRLEVLMIHITFNHWFQTR